MVKKIRFTIDAQGEVKVDVEGAVGGECDRLTGPFEEKLGTVGRKERKDSYFAVSENTLQESTTGGSHD